MQSRILKILSLVAVLGMFSQNALAQDPNSALKQISDIVASMNHFPSDADKATLATIAGNDAYPQGLRDMATTVSNISHSATAEGKQMMAGIQSSPDAPDNAKQLAGIIADLNHVASPEAKATLAQLFP